MRISILFAIFTSFIISACSSTQSITSRSSSDTVEVKINLQNIKDDKVKVEIVPPQFSSNSVTFHLPKIIPGTYRIADYGRYIEGLVAQDQLGNPLPFERTDTNTWVIQNNPTISKVTYFVNDTYDCEEGSIFDEESTNIFSPAGTNILVDKQFVLNMAGFVGYFKGKTSLPYKIFITHPPHLYGSTSLDDKDSSNEIDLFILPRYAEVIDHPIMYSEPNLARSKIGDLEVLLSMYSPEGSSINAESFYPGIEKMVRAQKNYLGNINTTKKYAILTYISSGNNDDAKGFGALEHNTSTTAVFSRNLKSQTLIDVISHEFFHTLTPLNVHSKEIHDFDFNDPKMSRHLWMYEGITEYFANHFQVHEGLISEDEFYARISLKERYSKQAYNDSLSFTEMSQHVLEQSYKSQYDNVYLKGALIAMCLDILLRETSNGEKGVLQLMGELSKKYGPEKPFEDDLLIPEITSMTNPIVGKFLGDHVINGRPINYDEYYKKVGLERTTIKQPTQIVYAVGRKLYLSIDSTNKRVIANIKDSNNVFMNSLGIKDGDELIEVNGAILDPSNQMGIISSGFGIKEDDEVNVKIIREGSVITLSGKAKLNYVETKGLKYVDPSKEKLKSAWLKQ